jgi:hypothetical protein
MISGFSQITKIWSGVMLIGNLERGYLYEGVWSIQQTGEANE